MNTKSVVSPPKADWFLVFRLNPLYQLREANPTTNNQQLKTFYLEVKWIES